jgi:hypothetical protein
MTLCTAGREADASERARQEGEPVVGIAHTVSDGLSLQSINLWVTTRQKATPG